MKKVLCQMCGLMNLEKFVTYPHCAGCGTRLAETSTPSSYAGWTRPLRAPLWASLVGLCCAGLGYWAITIARETNRSEDRQLMAYVLTSREASIGHSLTVQVTLDTTEGDTAVALPGFDNVRLRVPGANFRNFNVVCISPRSEIAREGNGRYFAFDYLSRDEPIVLQLVPLRPGKAPLSFSLFVRDFASFDYRTSIHISRPAPSEMPH